MSIQGVGHGTMDCEWQVESPIAMTDEQGQAKLQKITAPIVQRAGENLPGLLGLRSMEQGRAILDTGGRMLHLVGRGDVQLTLPPGSVSIPLHKAPSGHLVMIIDDYEKVSEKKGGIKEAPLQLHAEAEPGRTRESQPSSSSSAAPSRAQRAEPDAFAFDI